MEIKFAVKYKWNNGNSSERYISRISSDFNSYWSQPIKEIPDTYSLKLARIIYRKFAELANGKDFKIVIYK